MELLTSDEERKQRRRDIERRHRQKKLSEDPDHFNRLNARYRNRHPVRQVLWSARARAKKRGIPFALIESDIVIPTHCPVLGIPMQRSTGCKTDNSPTLDRIIPHLGYVPGNIAVISERANRIKNNATKEEIALLYRWLLKHETIH